MQYADISHQVEEEKEHHDSRKTCKRSSTEIRMTADELEEQKRRDKEAAEQATLPYKWKQTLTDVDVTLSVPAGTKGRQLNVVITSGSLTVGFKGQPPIIDASTQ